jgi:hypothetical protein
MDPLSALRARLAQPDAGAQVEQQYQQLLNAWRPGTSSAEADTAAMMPETFMPSAARDWSTKIAHEDYSKLFDPPRPRPADDSPVLFKSKIGNITERSIEDAMGVGMAFSGGGLATKLTKPLSSLGEIKAPTILPRQEPTPADIDAIKAAAVEYGRKGWPDAQRPVFSTTPEAYAETQSLVPQVSIKDRLPGPLPGEKLPKFERAQPMVDNADKLGAAIAEDLHPLVKEQSPLLKFYHTAPVIRGIEKHGEMSAEEASQFMRDWSGQGAATSPRTQTPPNLRNSSYLMYERARGDPLTPERYAREGNAPGFPMMGMHVDLADKFARGTENLWTNPKPGTFRENWSGNLSDVTADTHNIRSTLYKFDQLQPGELPRHWFNSDEAYATYKKDGFQGIKAGDIADTLESKAVNKIKRQSEYLPMADPWYRAADQLGIAPAEAQSGGWFRYGGITGLQSPPKTITNLLNDQIGATAKTLDVPEEKILNWWSRGKIPLASLAGGATLAPAVIDRQNNRR